MVRKKLVRQCTVKGGKKVDLSEYKTDWAMSDELRDGDEESVKEQAAQILERNKQSLAAAQELLWASNTCSVLIVLQGMDGAGKDGTIKHVMSGVNPQGCKVHSFKVPTPEEIDHDFLWRYSRCLPGRGEIGIFNRSYYEDVLVVRVHPELLDAQRMPPGNRGEKFWKERYKDINAFERHLSQNGTLILKFFLHISKEEQRKRLLKRLDDADKLWKFDPADLKERAFWDDYVRAYEAMLTETSTKHAPWYIVPSDHKWAARALVADIVATEIERLDLSYPKVPEENKKLIAVARKELDEER
ncbi:MAG: polyphosphate kinase 2 family protein [Methanomassiliicoccales archaeon]|nr:polyphosphate kinase 2 family protein [Methanomassiliicoccales archaeon]